MKGNRGAIGMKFSEGELKRLHQYLNSLAFKGRTEAALRKATRKVGLFLVTEFTENIEASKYKSLSRLTSMLRRAEGYGQVPLIRRGGLQRALSSDVVSNYHGRAGLLARRSVSRGSKKGTPNFDKVGKLLHDGGVIRIRAKSWAKFVRYLAAKGIFDRQRASKKSTGTGDKIIRIPARRFVSRPASNPSTHSRMRGIYIEAITEEYRK